MNTTKFSQHSATAPQDEGPSKTQRKAAMDALQDLGVKLIALPNSKLAKLELPERLLEAVQEAKRITANGAIRRQKQYIGSLMREIDVAPIEDQLQRWEGKHSAESAYFHQLENWRDRLLAEDGALPEFLQQHPAADIQQLRTLIRNARREATANKPPKSSRELFKLLRALTEAENVQTETLDEVVEDD